MTEDIMGALGDRLDPGLVVAARRLPRPRGLRRVGRDLLGRRRARGARSSSARRPATTSPSSPSRTSATTGTQIRDARRLRRPDEPRRGDGPLPAVLQVATDRWSGRGVPRAARAPGWPRTPSDAPRDYGAILPPDLVDEGVAWQRRLFDAGYAGIHWPSEYGGRGLTPRAPAASGSRSAPAPACRRSSTWSASCWPAARIQLLRHTRAAGAHLRPTLHGRPGVVPAVQRARRGQRPGRSDDARRARRRRASWSTARRCGARAVATATGAS